MLAHRKFKKVDSNYTINVDSTYTGDSIRGKQYKMFELLNARDGDENTLKDSKDAMYKEQAIRKRKEEWLQERMAGGLETIHEN